MPLAYMSSYFENRCRADIEGPGSTLKCPDPKEETLPYAERRARQDGHAKDPGKLRLAGLPTLTGALVFVIARDRPLATALCRPALLYSARDKLARRTLTCCHLMNVLFSIQYKSRARVSNE